MAPSRVRTWSDCQDSEDPLGALSTRSPELLRLIEYARHVAPTPYSVLIEGETGTGKEVFARGIHVSSARSGPFVPINCSAVPENMFEAELFGARRGAYTGLDTDRPGLLRVAHEGTVFLDEVGDLPASVQAKLLRVLDDRVVRPLGSTDSYTVDVRIIAATHKGLATLVEDGMFRSDLFFRLSATYLRLPPVRERPEDLPTLIGQSLEDATNLQSVGTRTIHPKALAVLIDYAWPGNIRELNNVIATAVLNAQSDVIKIEDLPMRCRERRRRPSDRNRIRFDLPFFEALAEFEREYLADVLRRAKGNLSSASRMCKLSRGALRNKARAYGLLRTGEPPTKATRARVRKPRSTNNDS